MPQFGEQVWLCCCGNKNPNSKDACEVCGREKEWQKNTATADAIEETKNKMISDPKERTFHDKSKFAQNKYLENDADVQKKISQYEKAMERIAMEEKRKEKNQMMILPKVCLWILFFLLIASIAQYIAFGEGIIKIIVTIFEILIEDIKTIIELNKV